jgi:hypothetical protein
MNDTYIVTLYLGINLASAGAAAFAGFHWLRSATLSLHGADEAAVRYHNWVAAFCASLAALCQAAVAAKASIDNMISLWR